MDLDAFLAQLAPHAYGWPASLRWTYDTTRRLLAERIPGDLVECGVAAGVHPAAMAKACIDAGEARNVRLFDSFEGLPHGGRHDREWNAHYGDGSGLLEPTGVSACSLEDVQANLTRWLRLEAEQTYLRYDGAVGLGRGIDLYKGWFQNTLQKAAISRIAFLRLDCDLYGSYQVCLNSLYDLCSPGAAVVLDDFNLDGCREAFFHFFDARRELPPTVTHITESGDVWWTKP